MSQAHFLRRGRRFALNDVSSTLSVIDPLVLKWAAQVVTNGGALPSLSTQIALSNFVIGLRNDGLFSSIIFLNAFVPDSLTAALTPLFANKGNLLWTNVGPFVSGDLTVNGLTGNGSTKYLDSGMLGTDFNSDNLAGGTLYCHTTGTSIDGGDYEMGYTNDAGSPAFLLSFNYLLASKWTGLIWSGTDPNPAVSSAVAGYLSINRIASNDLRLYFANSLNAHAQIGSTSTANNSTRFAASIYVFASNHYNVAAPFGRSSATLSLAATHDGFSSAQSSKFFDRIQTMRTALGGGFN